MISPVISPAPVRCDKLPSPAALGRNHFCAKVAPADVKGTNLETRDGIGLDMNKPDRVSACPCWADLAGWRPDEGLPYQRRVLTKRADMVGYTTISPTMRR